VSVTNNESFLSEQPNFFTWGRSIIVLRYICDCTGEGTDGASVLSKANKWLFSSVASMARGCKGFLSKFVGLNFD